MKMENLRMNRIMPEITPAANAMSSWQITIYIVDNDESERRSLAHLMKSAGYAPATFASVSELLADQQQKGLASGERPRAPNRMPVTLWRPLLHEMQALAVATRRRAVAVGIVRTHDHTNFLHAGTDRLLDNDGQRRFRFPIAIHEGLERQVALVRFGSGNEGFLDVHGVIPPAARRQCR
jgi:hypothetical protein